MRLILLAAAIVLAGCATPAQYGAAPKQALDRDTAYTVDERPDGYTVSVRYERYQFFPQTEAGMAACKAALLATAHEVADKKGRKIEPVNEQRVRISTGRNILSGVTSCEASVPVAWK